MRTEVNISDKGKTIYTYDDNDLEIHVGEYNLNGQLLEETISCYDSKNRSTGWISYNSSGDILRQVKLIYSTTPNHESEIIEYGANMKLIRRTEFIFDDNCRPIKELHYNNKNKNTGYANIIYGSSGRNIFL